MLVSTPPDIGCAASAGVAPLADGAPVAIVPPSVREAPGTWSGLNASVTTPEPVSHWAIVTPGGCWKFSTGRFFSATAMKSCQIGPATAAPVSLLPSVVGLS